MSIYIGPFWGIKSRLLEKPNTISKTCINKTCYGNGMSSSNPLIKYCGVCGLQLELDPKIRSERIDFNFIGNPIYNDLEMMRYDRKLNMDIIVPRFEIFYELEHNRNSRFQIEENGLPVMELDVFESIKQSEIDYFLHLYQDYIPEIEAFYGSKLKLAYGIVSH